MVRRGAITVDALLELPSIVDVRAPGGVVTAALCGHWNHSGSCRWPHNSRLDSSVSPAALRTVVVVDDDTKAEVVQRIESALHADERWSLVNVAAKGVEPADEALAERLLDNT